MGAYVAKAEASLRRASVEAGREMRRAAILRLAGAYVLVSTVLAMFFGGGRYFEWYLRTVYLFVPLLMVLLGARCVVRDHRRGFSFVVATTPLTHVEAAFAKVLFLGSFLGVCIALTLPVTLALTAVVRGTAATDALLQLHPPSAVRALVYALLGFLVGLFSGVLGLVVGHAMNRRRRSPWTPYAVAVGGALWFGLAALAAFLALRPERSSTPVQGVLQVSPVSLALDALDLVPETHVVAEGISDALDGGMRWALIAGLVLAVLAALVGLSRREGRRVPMLCFLVGALGLTLVTVPVGLTARYGVTDVEGTAGLLPVDMVDGLVVRSVLSVPQQTQDAVEGLTLAGKGVVKVRLHLQGPRNAAYVVDRVCLVAPGIRFDAPSVSGERSACRDVGEKVQLDAAGNRSTAEYLFNGNVTAPDGDLATVRVDATLHRIDVDGLPSIAVSLGNPIGVAGDAKALVKPARLALVSAVGISQLFGMGLAYVSIAHARKAKERKWRARLGARP